jgi:hypothetical protein
MKTFEEFLVSEALVQPSYSGNKVHTKDEFTKRDSELKDKGWEKKDVTAVRPSKGARKVVQHTYTHPENKATLSVHVKA